MKLEKYKQESIAGRPLFVVIAWMLASRVFFETFIPWPSKYKVGILIFFGAKLGHSIVIKPNVKIKYPWKLAIGSNSWIGEFVWIDNLSDVSVGENCCISQNSFILTGNHDYKKDGFDLILGDISIHDGSWVGAKSIVCPNTIMRKGTILSVGSVLTTNTKENSVYQGNPAIYKRDRY